MTVLEVATMEWPEAFAIVGVAFAFALIFWALFH